MTSASNYPVVKGTLVSTDNYTWNTADSLGKGASAVVYLGRNKVTGEYVAVKVFHDHVYQGYKTDDLRELELLRQLKHQNIINLLNVEKTAVTSKLVIIMEYCEGGSLHHMIDQPQYSYGLTEDEYLLVLYHVCSGMEYLQLMNVIHRDIKPGNIMRFVTKDGFSLYKLTDFGAARNLYEDENFQSLYGTEEYLHPGMYERAVLRLPNSQTFDAKVDLWSLGVTFYHTATGQLPFRPYGGRSNRRTMFEIITQKESGVISGVQTIENGPIELKRDLPETCPLSSGLKSIVIPLLAGLMEPDASKMITYSGLFRIVHNIKEKITINVFYYNKCEELVIYADPSTALSGLQDLIAAQTDLTATDQILIVGAKALEEVVYPLSSVQSYPSHLRRSGIYLFQREITEVHKLAQPDLPPMPDLLLLDIEGDARQAHSCASWGELVKRIQHNCSQQQERLISGLLSFRMFTESRLQATKVSHEYTKQLLDECKNHIDTLYDMLEILHDIVANKNPDSQDAAALGKLLDPVIRHAHSAASERMQEIEKYREGLVKKLEEIKVYASKFSAACSQAQCGKKIDHALSIIQAVYNRFRRDRNVKHQMTSHDFNIHRFEGALTKCYSRVVKVERNIGVVQKCLDMIIGKLRNMKNSGIKHGVVRDLSEQTLDVEMAETGALLVPAFTSEMGLLSSGGNVASVVEPQPAGMTSMFDQLSMLKEKLGSVVDILDENSHILLQSLEDGSIQASSSLSRAFLDLPELNRDHT
ncbi:hypothetical protein BsWGS_13721 [Bradybaena similaris]